MKRDEIINRLIKKHKYKSYLEIGLDDGVNFNKINPTIIKVSVDPSIGDYAHAKPTYKVTSDEFFKNNIDMFDIIFIDGLHHSEQVYKDIKNSLKFLNKGGTIVCHDMNPTEIGQQTIPRSQRVWTGDCWKALVKLRLENLKLEVKVIDTDYGVGIINESLINDSLIIDTEINFENFMLYKKEWINITAINEFKKNG